MWSLYVEKERNKCSGQCTRGKGKDCTERCSGFFSVTPDGVDRESAIRGLVRERESSVEGLIDHKVWGFDSCCHHLWSGAWRLRRIEGGSEGEGGGRTLRRRHMRWAEEPINSSRPTQLRSSRGRRGKGKADRRYVGREGQKEEHLASWHRRLPPCE